MYLRTMIEKAGHVIWPGCYKGCLREETRSLCET